MHLHICFTFFYLPQHVKKSTRGSKQKNLHAMTFVEKTTWGCHFPQFQCLFFFLLNNNKKTCSCCWLVLLLSLHGCLYCLPSASPASDGVERRVMLAALCPFHLKAAESVLSPPRTCLWSVPVERTHLPALHSPLGAAAAAAADFDAVVCLFLSHMGGIRRSSCSFALFFFREKGNEQTGSEKVTTTQLCCLAFQRN